MDTARAIEKPTLRRVGAALGAEITGLDLSDVVDEATIDYLRRALTEHHVIVVRRQSFTEERQVTFTRRMGPLEAFPGYRGR